MNCYNAFKVPKEVQYRESKIQCCRLEEIVEGVRDKAGDTGRDLIIKCFIQHIQEHMEMETIIKVLSREGI